MFRQQLVTHISLVAEGGWQDEPTNQFNSPLYQPLVGEESPQALLENLVDSLHQGFKQFYLGGLFSYSKQCLGSIF